MACSDPRFQALIADAALERLSPGEKFQLRNHLQQCESCLEILLAGAALAGKDSEALLNEYSQHISETELTDYYLGALTRAPERQSEIARHLETCAECREELELLEDIERQINVVAQREPRLDAVRATPRKNWRRVLWNPVLAYALLLAVAVPAGWLLLKSQSRLTDAGLEIPRAIELRETTRSSGSVQTVYRSGPDHYLHLRFPVPHRVQTHDYRIAAAVAESLQYWLNFADSGTIDALIDLGPVPDGRLTLVVQEIDTQDRADTLFIPFTIQVETIPK